MLALGLEKAFGSAADPQTSFGEAAVTPEGRLKHVKGAWNIVICLILTRTLAGITGLIFK